MAGSGWASWSLMVVAVVALWSVSEVSAVPALAPEQCGASGCTLNNAYRLWNDRSPCKAAKVVYPTSEEEIVAEVAKAVRANQKIKVSTAYGHSIPKVACPGTDTGLIISSRNLVSFLDINKAANIVTVQSGITMRALADGLAAHNLAIPVAPFFDGVTLGGVIANSVHGSTLWGQGGAVHEYVVGVRLVTPASAAEGYARVRDIALGDPDLNAARVHLGVLGVVATVTLQVEPQFKRSVTFKITGEERLTGARVAEIAKQFQYGEVTWYPSLREVVYKLDERVPLATPGHGNNNFFGMQPQARVVVEAARAKEEFADRTRNRASKCILAAGIVAAQQAIAYGYEHHSDLEGVPNPGIYPVTGTQDQMMNGGGCQRDRTPLRYCAWDARISGLVFYEDSAALPLRKLAAFLDDVRLLRERAPNGSLCDLDMYTGILMRFVKPTDAYLGLAQEGDTVMMDLTWTRGGDATTPRLDMDVFQEIEQLMFDKHGARPHWGKNRNAPFDGASAKYPKLKEFLAVKARFDPAGVFSSEWSDAILGIQGNVASDAPFCAIEGNCKCSRDEHCAPREGYFCRPGLVYPDARVCRYESHY